MPKPARSDSFARDGRVTPVDRFGRWLSSRRAVRAFGASARGRAADVGCGYDAGVSRALFRDASSLTLIDLQVDSSLAREERVQILEGPLPAVLERVADGAFDAILCNNVIEHLDEPLATLVEINRTLAPNGVAVINVPSWRGKVALETAAFRFRVAPAAEMDDHRTYFDPRDLWPLLVKAGFQPSRISCRRHKFGLNTIARCTKA